MNPFLEYSEHGRKSRSELQPKCPRCSLRLSAFTLIEVLAVIGIVGVLAALGALGLGQAREAARRTGEVSAARQLMVGWHLDAAEHRGRFMPAKTAGFLADITDEDGRNISGPPTMRWPHRLRPYLGDRFRDTLYVNRQTEIYEAFRKANYHYGMSVYPSFGMNGAFIAGRDDPDASLLADDATAGSIHDVVTPQGFIAFTGAVNRGSVGGMGRYGLTKEAEPGHFYVNAPFAWTRSEQARGLSENTSDDDAYGYIAFRWGGRAVTAFMDGHVELKTSEELRDMRLWSLRAAETDDAGYTPGR